MSAIPASIQTLEPPKANPSWRGRLLAGGVALALSGAGRASIDRLLSRSGR